MAGAAGEAGQGGTGGSEPPELGEPAVFAPLGTVATCPVERLQNRNKTVRLFTWKAWNDTGLERSVLTSGFDSIDTYFEALVCSGWFGADGEARLGLAHLRGDYRTVFFTDEDGWVYDAFRVPKSASCLGNPAQTGARHGQSMGPAEFLAPVGGILVDDAAEANAVAFEVLPTPGGIGPQPVVMGDSRWAWRFYPGRIDALSVVDGSGYATVSPFSPGTVEASWLVTTGAEFFWGKIEWNAPAGQNVVTLHRSDGVNPSSPYFAQGFKESFAAPAYAHTHLGMMKGYNNLSINKFDKVEIWATPYSPGAQPAPYKVADYELLGMPDAAGGYGWYLVPMSNPANPTFGTGARAIRLTDGKSLTFELPEARLGAVLGVSPTHAWVTTQAVNENKGRYVARQLLP